MQDDRPRDVAVQIHNGDAAGYRPVPVVLLTKNGEELVSEEKPANIREEKEPLFTGTSAAVVAYRTFVLKSLVAVGVSASWACGRQFTKSALNTPDDRFYAPYFLVWFNTNFMTVCYPVFICYSVWLRGERFVDAHANAEKIFESNGLCLKSVLIKVTPFILLWIAANYLYSQALGHISASAALVIVSSNVAVVYALEWALLKQKFLYCKFLSAILAIVGVVASSLDSRFAGNLLGISLAVCCSFVSAFYKVLFKMVNGNADLGQVSLFMSCIGVINLLINTGPALLLIEFNVDHVEWHHIPWAPLGAAAILSLVFNFLTNFGIALIGPFAISIGMILGIPLSTAVDVLLRGMGLTAEFFVGSLLITLSFVLATFPLGKWFPSGHKNENET